MNDLSYTDWMKFQKSFFFQEPMNSLLKANVQFFTKALWPVGSPSQSLLVGFDVPHDTVGSPRIADYAVPETVESLVSALESRIKEKQKYDFIFINLTELLASGIQYRGFRSEQSRFFQLIRKLLVENRYGALLVNYSITGERHIPLPWLLSYALRPYLRLRDEKIGVPRSGRGLTYCVYFQSADEEPGLVHSSLEKTVLAPENTDIPEWVIVRPPARTRHEIFHPAKFPEDLIQKFLDCFTKPGDKVFDPMGGVGSTVVAAAQSKRHGFGVELNPKYVEIAKERIERVNPEVTLLRHEFTPLTGVVQGDAKRLGEIKALRDYLVAFPEPLFDYCITSPPYWSVLSNKGSEYQRSRRQQKLPQMYSKGVEDVSNISDYTEFLRTLTSVYQDTAEYLKSGGHLTVIVKNVKRNHTVYPIAWDLVARLCAPGMPYEFEGNTFWLQDDISMRPFAVGTHWVSNTVHQYCLHFKRR